MGKFEEDQMYYRRNNARDISCNNPYGITFDEALDFLNQEYDSKSMGQDEMRNRYLLMGYKIWLRETAEQINNQRKK